MNLSKKQASNSKSDHHDWFNLISDELVNLVGDWNSFEGFWVLDGWLVDVVWVCHWLQDLDEVLELWSGHTEHVG